MKNSNTAYKLIIAGLTLILIVVSFHSYNHKKAADHFEDHTKKYPYLDPALPFYNKEDLVVNIETLREYFRALPEKNKDWAEMSIYFEVVNTGANISVNNEMKIYPASLAKLPTAMIALKKVERGEWTMEQKFTVQPSDLEGRQIINDVGGVYTLKELLKAMLSDSDNTSWKMLLRNMSGEEILELGAAVGLDSAFISDDKISSKEYTRLLRSLYSATFLDYEHSNYILSLSTSRGDGDYLTAGIPENIPVAHKWGRNVDYAVYGDSGIVYVEGRSYLISVFIQAKDEDDDEQNDKRVKELMKQIGETSYSYMNQQ